MNVLCVCVFWGCGRLQLCDDEVHKYVETWMKDFVLVKTFLNQS
jgi:hypothetical protein